MIGFLIGAGLALLGCCVWGYYYYKAAHDMCADMERQIMNRVQPHIDSWKNAVNEHEIEIREVRDENRVLTQENAAIKDLLSNLRKDKDKEGLIG